MTRTTLLLFERNGAIATRSGSGKEARENSNTENGGGSGSATIITTKPIQTLRTVRRHCRRRRLRPLLLDRHRRNRPIPLAGGGGGAGNENGTTNGNSIIAAATGNDGTNGNGAGDTVPTNNKRTTTAATMIATATTKKAPRHRQIMSRILQIRITTMAALPCRQRGRMRPQL